MCERVRVYVCVCRGGQRTIFGSLINLFHSEFWALNSGCQAYMAVTFAGWPILQPEISSSEEARLLTNNWRSSCSGMMFQCHHRLCVVGDKLSRVQKQSQRHLQPWEGHTEAKSDHRLITLCLAYLLITAKKGQPLKVVTFRKLHVNVWIAV